MLQCSALQLAHPGKLEHVGMVGEDNAPLQVCALMRRAMQQAAATPPSELRPRLVGSVMASSLLLKSPSDSKAEVKGGVASSQVSRRMSLRRIKVPTVVSKIKFMTLMLGCFVADSGWLAPVASATRAGRTCELL
eukprot:1100418-Amphidinium_carterae.1